MRAAGISGVLPRKRRRTTVRLAGLRVAPDLVERDFRPDGPNLTWAADITYISTWEGFLYLAHTAVLFGKRCTAAGIEISKGSVGDCYDNAVCEAFHRQEGADLPALMAAAPRPEPPSSSTSKAGTTPAAGTPPSATSPQPSMNAATPSSQPSAPQRPASPSPATARPLPRSLSTFQPITLRPRRMVVERRT
jgi:transposase InsO family protein